MANLLQTIQRISEEGFTPEVKAKYSDDELYVLAKILDEIAEHGDSATLNALWASDFERRPVGIDEFLTNDYYLGKVGKDLYPVWRKDLRHVLSPYKPTVEWVIKGSIGSGKTFAAVIALIYKIYYLTCLKSPQRFYGLADGSAIVFGLFNIFKYLVQATSYQYLLTFLRDMSPYFRSMRQIDPRNKNKRERDKEVLNLPKNISIALGSSTINALGQNLIGGLMDETEFGKEKSITSTEKSQIEDLYQGVRTRMDSRFMQKGGMNPGLLCLVSSARDYEQFLAKHSKSERPGTYVSNYALYDVKPHVYADSPRFKVVVGDKLHRSYIADDEPDKPIRPDARVAEVPIEFLGAFRYDIDTALRDISGVETYGKTLLFPRRDLLTQGIELSTPRRHPFTKETIELGINDDRSIEDYFVKDEIIDLFDKTNRLYKPRFYPSADRFIHVDLAKNRDCAGLSMVCISEQRNILRYTDDGLPTNAIDYVFFVDLMLRIKAVQGSEIDFAKIRRFIFFLLKTCRFPVKRITYDSWQSTDSIQSFKKEKIESKELSVDRKPGPYKLLRSVAMELRLDMYYYDPFVEELTLLEDYTKDSSSKHKPKIDHPQHGSKDVSDAVCGAVTGALEAKGKVFTGTEAEIIKKRAEAHFAERQAQEVADLRKQGKFVKTDYRKQSELEEFFK